MKNNKEILVDDGRVIASMNLEGMPGVLYKPRNRHRFDEFGQLTARPEPLKLTKAERRAISLGVSAAHAAAFMWVILLVAAILLIASIWLT